MEHLRSHQLKERLETSFRLTPQRVQIPDGPNDEDMAIYLTSWTRAALMARRADEFWGKQLMAKKGREIKHIPAEWKTAFEFDKAEW